ncbi:LOW QUALITY PROTEIN: MORN repeat-containing protein 1 [Theristicus caerulescens]
MSAAAAPGGEACEGRGGCRCGPACGPPLRYRQKQRARPALRAGRCPARGVPGPGGADTAAAPAPVGGRAGAGPLRCPQGRPAPRSRAANERAEAAAAGRCWSRRREGGNTYSGQFVFGKLCGHKVLQYKDGGKYEGEFSYGMREGKGLNEDNYEGAWILDNCQGHGTLPCAVGTVYEGQWRNDVFNERGAIVNCSGDICDGLWINGYPAACGSFGRNHGGAGVSVQLMKRTTAEQIFTLQSVKDPTPGEYFLKELQHMESPCRSTCGLEIWAGIRNHQIPSSSATNLFELIEETERKTANSNSGFALGDLPIPKEIEPESGSDTPCGAGDASSSQHVCCANGSNAYMLQNVLSVLDVITRHHRKGGKKPSGRISAEKAEKMTVSQEKMEDSSAAFHKNEGFSVFKRTKVYHAFVIYDRQKSLLEKDNRTGLPICQYVLTVHEVTMPPFLGQTLPPAFKLRIFSEKTKTKDSFKVTSK